MSQMLQRTSQLATLCQEAEEWEPHYVDMDFNEFSTPRACAQDPLQCHCSNSMLMFMVNPDMHFSWVVMMRSKQDCQTWV